jgi:anti-sigma B factor antagonist
MNDELVPGFDEGKEESLKFRLEKIEQVPKCLAMHLSGYIDAYNHHFFQKQVTKAVEAGYTRIVLGMRGINFIGSMGVGGLVTLMNTLRSKSGDVVLQELQPKVYEVFQLLGFSRFFVVTDGPAESIAHFTQKAAVTVFPRVFACPICSVRLRASRAGRFRCSQCRTILVLDPSAAVSLG